MISKIENRNDVVKDVTAHAVLSVDITSYQAHINKRKQQSELYNRLNTMEKRILELEQLVSQLMDKN